MPSHHEVCGIARVRLRPNMRTRVRQPDHAARMCHHLPHPVQVVLSVRGVHAVADTALVDRAPAVTGQEVVLPNTDSSQAHLMKMQILFQVK